MEQLSTWLETTINSNLLGLGIIIVFIIAGYLVSTIIKRFVTRFSKNFDKTYTKPLLDIGQILLIAICMFIGARYAGVDITYLLAIVAIISTGIALSLESYVKNMIATAQLLITNYYKVGETISFDNITGKVHEINLFSTQFILPDQGLVHIPNSKIIDGPISNRHRQPVEITVSIPVLSAHKRSDVMGLIRVVVEENPDIIKSSIKVLHAWVNGCEEYTILVKVTNYDKRREIASALSIEISNELENAEIQLGTMAVIKHVATS